MNEEELLAEVNSAAASTEVAAPSEPVEEVVNEPKVEIVEKEFELPDGRKVSADGLEAEYNKLLPEFTRRSQRLAELEKIKPDPITQEKAYWENPEWQPKNWQEAAQAGRDATLREIQPILSEVEKDRLQKQVLVQAQEVTNAELAVLKAKDPKINEAELFKHANKGFRTLEAAYNDLQERKGLEKTIEARVLKNMKLREDPVSTSSATTPQDEDPSYEEVSQYRNVRDAAAAAFARIRK